MKRALSLVLVLVLALGMSVTSFAAISVNDDPAKNNDTGFSDLKKTSDGSSAGIYNDLGTVYAGSPSFTYKLAKGAFSVSAGDKASDSEKAVVNTITASNGYLKKALPKVVARTRIAKGSNIIDKIDITYNSDKLAQLEVKFVNPFKNNNPDGQEFDIWVFPVVGGKAWDYETKGINFTGTYKNDCFTVDAQTDYADLYNGYIAKIDANVRNVKFDLGNDITVNAKAYKGQKFWGKANQDVKEADIANMDKYPSIMAVYHLDVLGGLDKAANNVVIASANNEDYIFDGSLKFLGMGDSKNLPFSETYYVSSKMIEVVSEEEPIEANTDEEADPLVLAPQTGGEVSAPAGIFDNPSTGA
jgi:hypothetical protein